MALIISRGVPAELSFQRLLEGRRIKRSVRFRWTQRDRCVRDSNMPFTSFTSWTYNGHELDSFP